eukprot:Nk52_evm5s1485 gene=Nk52_evmTU5s1485
MLRSTQCLLLLVLCLALVGFTSASPMSRQRREYYEEGKIVFCNNFKKTLLIELRGRFHLFLNKQQSVKISPRKCTEALDVHYEMNSEAYGDYNLYLFEDNDVHVLSPIGVWHMGVNYHSPNPRSMGYDDYFNGHFRPDLMPHYVQMRVPSWDSSCSRSNPDRYTDKTVKDVYAFKTMEGAGFDSLPICKPTNNGSSVWDVEGDPETGTSDNYYEVSFTPSDRY